MDLIFILVKPGLPDNVGAAARAMKTMGFKRLRLVAPCDHLGRAARTLAHGSQEILEKAEVFETLDDALKDVDFSVAATGRKRHLHAKNWIPLEGLSETLVSKQEMVGKTAVVFGTEEHGLSNEELEACDIITSIPMAVTYPSLNLAQAVMVYAYVLSIFTVDKKGPSQGAMPVSDSFKVFKKRVEKTFSDLEIEKNSMFHVKVMKRIGLLSRTDLRAIHFFLDRLEGKLGACTGKGE